ncbi:hypothetical protein V8G54_027302 [Vigna mungo]|uniref:Uncharacterized protein n=1 Tax=Vigna mungo TaxID=3915 RepID=A0AAQ3RQB8_VIGMU
MGSGNHRRSSRCRDTRRVHNGCNKQGVSWIGRGEHTTSLAAFPASLREQGSGEEKTASNQSLSSTAKDGRGIGLEPECFSWAAKDKTSCNGKFLFNALIAAWVQRAWRSAPAKPGVFLAIHSSKDPVIGFGHF